MRIHSLVNSSRVNGPGSRAVLWTQGCSGMSCAAACWNKDSHDVYGGKEYTHDDLFLWARGLYRSGQVEGLTISGGEPLQSPSLLLYLLEDLKEEMPGLSIGIFSGYTEREAEQVAPWYLFKRRLDFAVLGRYNPLRPRGGPLCSSDNQKLVLLSDRYTLKDFAPLATEVTIDQDGTSVTTGFPILGQL